MRCIIVLKWFPITLLLLLTIEVPAEESSNDAPEKVEHTTQPGAVSLPQNERVPDFSAYQDVRQKKRVFFEFMLPRIREANARIRIQRARLITLSSKLEAGLVLQGGELQYLSQLLKRYRMKAPLNVNTQLMSQLLERVDIVPASLVLAQSANESGWGTSRFAIEANNYFGLWCFSSGCGLKPSSRDDGMAHEVASYNSVQQGVAAYMHNINTHRAYRHLRTIRSEQRYLQNHFMGLLLADGLRHYSERGEDYVREIKQMIRFNKLHEYTLASSALPT